MISLEEDYIGTSNGAVIVHGLKVCAGVVARLTNNRCVGAHFTNSTTPLKIVTGMTYVRNNWMNAGVQEMFLVLNIAAWQARTDKYASTHALIADLKLLWGHAGQVWVNDKNITGNSVDIRLRTAGQLEYRVTPNPDPMQDHPKPDVRVIRTARGSTTPTIQAMNAIFRHKIQTAAAAWTPYAQGQMIPL